MDLNQIRINDLARELEVAARAIIAYLPEAGVKGKKTHSQSINLETANKVRQHFRKLLEAELAAEAKARAERSAKFTHFSAARPEPPVALTVTNPAQALVAAMSTPVEVPVKSHPLVHNNRNASKRWAAALGELRRL